MARDYARRKLRMLADRIASGSRLSSRDASVISAVPYFAARVQRRRVRGDDVLEISLRTRGMRGWTSWMDAQSASWRLRDAGFVDSAVALLRSGARIDERIGGESCESK